MHQLTNTGKFDQNIIVYSWDQSELQPTSKKEINSFPWLGVPSYGVSHPLHRLRHFSAALSAAMICGGTGNLAWSTGTSFKGCVNVCISQEKLKKKNFCRMDPESKNVEICKMLPLVSKVYSDISSLKKQLNHAESKLEEQEKEIDDFQDVKEGDKSPQFSMPSRDKIYNQK